MPTTKIAKRGGAIRVRTVKLKDGSTMRVFVVRKRGPRGGRTVAGHVVKPKRKRGR